MRVPVPSALGWSAVPSVTFFAEAGTVLMRDPGPGSLDAPGEEGLLAAPVDWVSGPPVSAGFPGRRARDRNLGAGYLKMISADFRMLIFFILKLY